ncbi:PQQ-binding-like beta-propeller repeat protein [Spirillospora sp. CA-108201]
MVAGCLSRDPGERPPTDLLPSLLAAEPVAPGWLPGTLGDELRQREDTLLLDLREIAKARTRRRLLLGGAAAAGLAVIGGGTAAALSAAGGAGHRPSPPKALWRTTIGDLTDRAFRVGLLSRTVIPHDEGVVYRGHSLDTGRQLWSRRFSAVVGVDAATGRRLWTHEWPFTAYLAFLYGITNRTLVALGNRGSESLLVRLDTATGALRWADPEGSLTYVPEGGGNLIFRNPSGVTLDALAADTGHRLWTAELPKAAADPHQDRRLSSNITVAGGTVYTGVAGATGAGLYGWDAETGELVWNHPAATSAPTRQWALSTRDRTLVAAQDRTLLAFRLA